MNAAQQNHLDRMKAICDLDVALKLAHDAVDKVFGDTPEAYAAHRIIASNGARLSKDIDLKYPGSKFKVGDKVYRIEFTDPIRGYQPAQHGLTVCAVKFVANHYRVTAARSFLDDDVTLPLRDGWSQADQHMFQFEE